MDIIRLRGRLNEIGYSTDAVLERIGEVGQAGLQRNCTLPADVALARADDPLATLIRLFLLRQEVPAAVVGRAFRDCLSDVLAEEIVTSLPDSTAWWSRFAWTTCWGLHPRP